MSLAAGGLSSITIVGCNCILRGRQSRGRLNVPLRLVHSDWAWVCHVVVRKGVVLDYAACVVDFKVSQIGLNASGDLRSSGSGCCGRLVNTRKE